MKEIGFTWPGWEKTIFINRLANLVRSDLNQGDDNQQSSEEVVDQVW